ncbi:glycosyl hydrolase family 63 [Mucilaginibacter gracilis]|uniref:Glycosyl hydrolase family 63 n=1 Tax=Mucilaginibacter gracilis TaxID=423350 RepID=A0A495J726_9SPHI|nr:glucosidase [Mucilaginibacter gracilis]RKR83819.1 glycosyl hydrolase family 63 [Mucilaginibacter gracilis]
MTTEQTRLADHYAQKINWLKWGPYLSERQWGTVREDYSENGDAWNYISHDMARSKAYRWGEEGLAGISDDQQLLCMGLALWNEKDPILKERLFGLTNQQGNHGEDVKELYYYIDNTPSHSYMKMLYKYTQQPYPYSQLIDENQRRSKLDPEFELIDTGLFDDNGYFDVFIEYAKNNEDDLFIQYTICNRGVKDAPIHVIPQLWYRKTWGLGDDTAKPLMLYHGNNCMMMRSAVLGDYYFYADGEAEFLFTDNETNNERLYNSANNSAFVKDGINNRVVNGDTNAVNPQHEGTKAAIWYQKNVPAQSSITFKLRLSKNQQNNAFADFDATLLARKAEADEFYNDKQAAINNDDEKLVQRQAWAGMLWSKQFFLYDVNRWIEGDPGQPVPPKNRRHGRNHRWKHLIAGDIISMPDKWEYPWFAAWDLAFHCMSLAPIDPGFAKQQLALLVSAKYIHPSGQLPAYEWDFGDVNPPVHAMATWRVFEEDQKAKGKADIQFLEDVFHKMLLNFTWWVNQKDSEGNNIFEGGFLGLDNIGVFNRSAPVPGGGCLEQADGTSWMAMYALNMLHISAELAMFNPVYENMAIKFMEHFLYIAGSIANMGEDSWGLWDDQDGFYYDLLRKPEGGYDRLRLRTLVGLIPMFAVIVFDDSRWKNLPKLRNNLDRFMQQRPDLVQLVSYWRDTNGNEQHLLSLLRGHRMKLLLRRMLDSNEFLSEYGIRSISKVYEQQPFDYWLNGTDFPVRYNPAESDTGMFGGNSNWRGPIWMPINYLLIQSLYMFYNYYGNDFKVEYPTGSNQYFSLAEIAGFLSKRIKSIFLKNESGERPVFGGHPKLNHDPHFKDYILFHEYFNGDNGKGLGASHQTGWTGLVALL